MAPLLVWTLTQSAAMGLNNDSDLLPEHEAFAFSAELLPDRQLAVRWKIADGYYMYRDKISFDALEEGAIEAVELPPGKPKEDALFGNVEVYVGELNMVLPLRKDVAEFTLLANGQGCNEPVGVCYPPIQHEIVFSPGSGVSASPALSESLQPQDAGVFDPRLDSIDSVFTQVEPLPSPSAMQPAANDIPESTALVDPSSDSPSQHLAESGNAAEQAASIPTQSAPQVPAPVASDSALKDGNLGADRDASEDAIPTPVSDENTIEDQVAVSSKVAEDKSPDTVQQLRDLLSSGFDQPEYLAVEDAFKLSVQQLDAQTLQADFKIAEGYYLYREKIKFNGGGRAQVGEFKLPPGEIKEDQYIGRTAILRDSFTLPLRLSRSNPTAGLMSLEIVYQGCAEEGICYPPVTSNLSFSLPALISEAAAQTAIAATESGSTVASAGSLPPSPESSSGKDGRSLSALLLGAFIAGILLTFTPCVLPMIPILSSVIAGQGERLTRMRGGMLAICYVIGTAATYAAMGAMAGATGEQLQAYFQNTWAIGILAAIFVIMAVSMFGVFEFQMPTAIQSRLQASTGNMRGSIPLVFILGLVSALIVGACVSPVLISFLGIAVSRADPVLGAQIMFVMALGMGLPLIALGFGAGYLIPRAGAWMETVKHVFGVMLIGVAIYILGVLPQVPVLLLWGAFLIVISTYLGATQSSAPGSSGARLLAKGLGTVLLVWGIAALVGGFYGQRDLLKPLPESLFSANTAPQNIDQPQHLFTRIDSTESLAIQMDRAKSEGKGVMIDFYADWCVDCIKMEQVTFNNPAIVSTLMNDYVALQVDVTDPKDPGTSAVKKQLGVFGPPAVLFFDASGTPLKERNFYGYRDAEELLALLSEQ